MTECHSSDSIIPNSAVPQSTNAIPFETPELMLTAANFNSRIWGLSHLANADYNSYLQRKVLSIERENSYFHTGH